MLDINLIREKPDVVKASLKKRGALDKLALIDEIIKLDRVRRAAITEVNELKHKRNRVSEEIGKLKSKGGDVSKKIEEIKEIPGLIKRLDKMALENTQKMEKILYRLPNVLHESVPVGADESDSREIRRWGNTDLAFEAKDHIDLGIELDLIDVERASKVSGARFYYLKNELVLLNYALMKFALDVLNEKGFELYQPPYMLRRNAVENATDLSDFEDVIYRIEGEDLYLIPTSEFALLALHTDEILDGEKLPLRYCGISPCFRKEAGSHGRDTKGIFRVHQFEKVEQFVFCRPEDSWAEHEMLVKNAEEVFQRLEIPYRVTNICTGDMGTVAAKKYDLEAWLPGQKKYREVVSCSNCTDYQARRAKVRFRDKINEPTRSVHTLNSTLIATQRTIVAILENHQQEDGGIKIPSALVPYMGGLTKISGSL